MTERLDRIEASIEATAAICGSNARAIEATGEQIGELRNTVTAFIQKLDEEGLRVTLVTEIADDMGGDVSYLESQVNRQDVSITALREAANADRQAWQANFDAQQLESRQRFDAQQEVIQTLLAQLVATNQDVAQAKNNISGLSDRVDNLEEAS